VIHTSTFNNCVLALLGSDTDLMRQIASAVLHQGGRVWLLSDQQPATKKLADSLSDIGPVDYYWGDFSNASSCNQVAELIYQTDGYLNSCICINHPAFDTMKRAFTQKFFHPQNNGHMVRWLWDKHSDMAQASHTESTRIHSLFASPSPSAIPHVLHLASPAAENLVQTELTLQV
jgi:NAD(P)-dependent dehydrogenase (short-subunit alcohol dehydrogenase family)